MSELPHPLLAILLAAADGVFPPVDGRAVLVPLLPRGIQAVVSFTGHAVLATDRPAAELAALKVDGYGAALHPDVLRRLAGSEGDIGVIDVTLVARGVGGGQLPARADLDGHPRVRHARALRQDLRVFGDGRGLVTLAHGLAGRTELSVELTGSEAGRGAGTGLVRDALGLVPAGEPVFAAVAPGNARSLRAFLRLGFVPIGSEVLIAPRANHPAPGSTT